MFSDLDALAPDALLGLTKLFAEDKRAKKIDLGVGVFRDKENRTPILRAVKTAEERVFGWETSKVYTPPEGASGFGDAVARLLLGEAHPALADGRCAVVQTIGGCGAVRLGGELLKRVGAECVTSGAPTWANHQPLLMAAGLRMKMIPYYDAEKRAVQIDGFMGAVEKLGPEDALLLHGPCHNPSGADLSREQIDAVLDRACAQGFFVFIDAAYHGFAEGLDEDAYLPREAARRLPELLISYSCSKNFGLYRERTGALIAVAKTPDRASAVKSHLLNLARGNYSMPPAHGGEIVAEILTSPELTTLWREELSAMREAIRENRRLLVRTAAEMQMGDALSYIERQNGMFSLLPLSVEQVMAMRERHGIYMAGNGRINLCGVNEGNVAHLCEALRDVAGK
ncbi:MAG: aminotransferase class I/II-fold pyridoxal phosphate-dependent enzyme [Alphaproteobacteria bacterium]|nr:aminotransferase class I/II-fold pyridoxal phosphate-dependent enzyme [Alphaproteobacteria bacterium]